MMQRSAIGWRLGLLVGLLLVVGMACRSPGEASPSPAATEAVDAAASVTAAVMTAVAEVLQATPALDGTAVAGVGEATATATAVTETPLPTAAPATPTAVPVCTTLQALNFRSGPGTSYSPPLRTIPGDTVLEALAFSPIGFPGGQWVQVRDPQTAAVGWVSAGTQYVQCNLDLNSLPVSSDIPPTPALAAGTAAPTQVAAGPPRVTNNAPVGAPPGRVAWELVVNDRILFRLFVADTAVSGDDGAGVSHVEFFIAAENGEPVYYRRENIAAYCIFGGGEPNCNPWPFEGGRYRWGTGGPPVEPGRYLASILATPQEPSFEGEVWNWEFEFVVE